MNRELASGAMFRVEQQGAGVGLVIGVTLVIAAVGCVIRLFGFRAARAFVEHTPVVRKLDEASRRLMVGRVQVAIAWAQGFRLTPAMCLRRAVAAAVLLRLVDIPAVVVIGIQRLPFAAHAWTEVYGQVITEREGWVHDYQIIDSF